MSKLTCQHEGASGWLQDKTCPSTGAGGSIRLWKHVDANSTANYRKNGAVSQTERAGPCGRVVILGLLSDRRLHRCGDDKLHRWLIARVARRGDDRRSPEQKRLLVSPQAWSLGEMGPTPRVRGDGDLHDEAESLFFFSNNEPNLLLTSYL